MMDERQLLYPTPMCSTSTHHKRPLKIPMSRPRALKDTSPNPSHPKPRHPKDQHRQCTLPSTNVITARVDSPRRLSIEKRTQSAIRNPQSPTSNACPGQALQKVYHPSDFIRHGRHLILSHLLRRLISVGSIINEHCQKGLACSLIVNSQGDDYRKLDSGEIANNAALDFAICE